MGWLDYYRLYEKYGDDLSFATMAELDFAKRANPNDWQSAWQLAKKKWQEHNALKKFESYMAYIMPKVNQLRDEGYDVEMLTPHHFRINGELEVYCGYGKCKYKPVGKNRKPRECQGLLHIVHNWFGGKGKGIAAASFKHA